MFITQPTLWLELSHNIYVHKTWYIKPAGQREIYENRRKTSNIKSAEQIERYITEIGEKEDLQGNKRKTWTMKSAEQIESYITEIGEK